jgi:hypothetical protein
VFLFYRFWTGVFEKKRQKPLTKGFLMLIFSAREKEQQNKKEEKNE